MTSTLTKPRFAVAAATSLTLVGTLLGAPAALADGPYDDRIALEKGHADVLFIKKDDQGNAYQVIHSDEFGDHAPEEFIVHAKPSVASRTASASVAPVLGINSGDTYYVAPQRSMLGQLFIGLGYSHTDWLPGEIEVTHTISNYNGAGSFALWQNGEEGPETWVSSAAADWSFSSRANHEHMNWGFSAEGLYTFDVTSSYTVWGGDGTVYPAGTSTYTFFVGEELPTNPGTPPGDVTVEITGLGAHYHTGNVASLTAVVTGSDEDHFHWFTRPNDSAEWQVVPGALTNNYGFVVTGEQQVKAVLYDHDHNVIAESTPALIKIDDHGNTPGVGPELNVSLEENQGALVISVAPGSERSQLSPLELNPAADRYVSTGEISGITVTDTRNGAPGWKASGRVRDLATVDGAVLDGKYLGWSPVALSASQGQTVAAGPVVTPGFIEGSGIKGWSVLGEAPAGASNGTAVLGADIRIEAPTTTTIGDYTGVVLITVI